MKEAKNLHNPFIDSWLELKSKKPKSPSTELSRMHYTPDATIPSFTSRADMEQAVIPAQNLMSMLMPPERTETHRIAQSTIAAMYQLGAVVARSSVRERQNTPWMGDFQKRTDAMFPQNSDQATPDEAARRPASVSVTSGIELTTISSSSAADGANLEPRDIRRIYAAIPELKGCKDKNLLKTLFTMRLGLSVMTPERVR